MKTISSTATTGSAIAFFLFFGFISSAFAAEIFDLTSDDFRKLVGQDKHVLISFYTQECVNCKRLVPEYEKFADHLNSKNGKSLVLATMDCDKQKSICERYDLTVFPTIRIFQKKSVKPREYIGKPSAEGLAEFVNYFAGTTVKITNPPSSVVVITADNFKKIVLDETKHVLVEFYAPWCTHCQSLAPIYEKLAAAFKLEDDVVIAKCEADKYKLVAEKYGVSGFPTLKFFPKGNKAGENYSGERELVDFVEFINEKCGTARDAHGKLTTKAGIIKSLDNLVKKFVNATGEEQKILYSLMKEEVEKLKDSSSRHGKIYLKAAKSSMEKGPDYARNELERINRVASKPISDVKADEFALKKNILSTFY